MLTKPLKATRVTFLCNTTVAGVSQLSLSKCSCSHTTHVRLQRLKIPAVGHTFSLSRRGACFVSPCRQIGCVMCVVSAEHPSLLLPGDNPCREIAVISFRCVKQSLDGLVE